MKLVAIVSVSLIALGLIAVGTLLIVGGILQTPQYLKAWSKGYAEQFADPRIQLVASALLAPSSHNMQPWKIALDASNPDVFYLYTDSSKLTPEVDPLARQTLISEGTFLEYLRVAGDHKGLSANIELFPNGAYDEKNLQASMDSVPIARITITNATSTDGTLYDGLFLSDTNRGPYTADTLTPDEIKQLQTANADPDLTVTIFQDPADLQTLGAYATAGNDIENKVRRINAESAVLFRSNETQKNKYRYGFSVEGQGTSGLMVYFTQSLITLFPSLVNENASQALAMKITNQGVTATPAYMLVTSKDNSRTNQVKAGMLYSHLMLLAHTMGLVMQPTSQVLEEYSEMSEQYKSIHKEYASEGGTLQMFVRIGTPTQSYPVSMRRGVDSFIIH